MKNLRNTLLVTGALALLALSAVAPAQRGQGGGGRGQGGMRWMQGGGGAQSNAFLLARTDVRDDLKLTGDQVTQLDALKDEMQSKMREMFSGGERPDRDAMQKMMADMGKTMDAKVATILTPAQTKRLGEIAIQMGGMGAVSRPEVATALALTEDQKTKIKTLQESMARANGALGEKVRSGDMDRDAMMETRRKNAGILDAEIGKVLTDAQKEKLKTMAGAPFKKDEDAR